MFAFVRLLPVAAFSVFLAMPAPAADRAISDPAFNPYMGTRPTEKMPFPPIKDWNSLSIKLERTACYGTCPVYSVEIDGDGTVSFYGEHFVAVQGMQTAKIPLEKVRALYEAFVKAEFFWTFDQYEAPITDLPTQIISISFDGHSKTVLDYAGDKAGMPKAINDLEQAVDAAAGTARWVHKKE